MAKQKKNNEPCCCLCGRSGSQVFLFTGMQGYVCADCVETAHEMIVSASTNSATENIDLDKNKLPKPKEIKNDLLQP